MEITGTVTFQNGYEILEWNCPLTGMLQTSQGEHYYDEELEAYTHDVYEEDSLTIAYTVKAK